MSKSKKNNSSNSGSDIIFQNMIEDKTNSESGTGGHLQIVIEKNVPIPTIRAKTKYPFDKMNVGDSFVINKKTNAASVTVAYWKKKLPGTDYTVRAIDENSSRVWRIDSVNNSNNVESLVIA